MRSHFLMGSLLVFLMTAAAVSAFAINDNGTYDIAADSCGATSSRCVARCRRDVPQDKTCPTDHCLPKLAACKSSGCWTEGSRYGGQTTCNLQKG